MLKNEKKWNEMFRYSSFRIGLVFRNSFLFLSISRAYSFSASSFIDFHSMLVISYTIYIWNVYKFIHSGSVQLLALNMWVCVCVCIERYWAFKSDTEWRRKGDVCVCVCIGNQIRGNFDFSSRPNATCFTCSLPCGDKMHDLNCATRQMWICCWCGMVVMVVAVDGVPSYAHSQV